MFPVYSSNGFGNGLGSLAPGLNSDVFGSLQRSLTDYMYHRQIQPFIQEVRSMANERFGFGENQVSNFGPGVGDATLKVPDEMLPPLTDTMGSSPVAAGTAPQPMISNPAPMISNPAPMLSSERDPDRFRDAFNAFRNTLRPEGDLGRYVAPGETITYDQFVELGRPADLAAAEAAGYGGGALLSDGFGNNVSLSGLAGITSPGRGLAVSRNFAEGGPVMMNRDPMATGLGSFLASNIDEFGRNGDTEVIHATKSEVVLPKGMVDNPEVRRTVRDLFEQTGRDMQEYTVGSGEMNVNPMTGYEEAFDLIGGIKDIFKKAAPVLLPIATTFLFPGMSPFLSGALAGGVGSLIQGGSIEDAFKEGIKGGLVSSATNALFNPGQRNPFKPVDSSYENAFDLRKDPLGDLGLGGKAAASNAKGYFMNPAQPGVSYADAVETVTAAQPNLAPSAVAETAKSLVTKGAPASMNLGRTIAGGLGALALAGGFDEIPAEEIDDAYPYSSRELMEMYPERYRTGPVIAPTRLPLEDKIEFGTQFAANGGEMDLANDPRLQKERMTFPRRQGYIAGPGTETSDDIPAMLSDGEFVMTARAVRGAGDGSRKDGVKKMYDIMRAFEGGVVS